jgi:hypothetical protein
LKASAAAPVPTALASITPPAHEPDDAAPVRLSIAGGVVRRALMRRDGATTISTIAAVPAGCDTDDLESVADSALLRCAARPEYDAGGEPMRFADLFSGCGALSLGVMEAARTIGRTPVCTLALDLAPDPIAVFRASLGVDHARTGDLAELVDGNLRARACVPEDRASGSSRPRAAEVRKETLAEFGEEWWKLYAEPNLAAARGIRGREHNRAARSSPRSIAR